MYFIKAYRYLNLLSIDVALGAVCCALFFAKMLRVRILPYGLIALGFTVWIIYTADHLLDARSIKKNASTTRHRFHQQNFNLIAYALACVAIIAGILIFFIRQQVLTGGIVLLACVGVYLLVQRYINYLKEIVIAVFYTAGVLLPSVMVTDIPISNLPWIVIVQFLIFAFINLLIFSVFDYENDLCDNTISFVTHFGKRAAGVCIWILFASICLLTLFSSTLSASLIVLAMAFVLMGIYNLYSWFAKHDRFRLFGDAVFIVPVLYLLF